MAFLPFLNKLTLLNLNNNRLTKFEHYFFNGLIKLVNLNVTNNEISEIQYGTIQE